MLDEYQQKRHFPATPEPAGGEVERRPKLHFVVQKHAASHLHNDLRLELDGVLKSWAVPKGPSMNPADKRLAIMVEDHPVDYENFEGIIPPGNYGAGTVMVWDKGTYGLPEKPADDEERRRIAQGLHKGHLGFELEGDKLKGGFDLIRTPRSGENHWLLVKRPDRFASTVPPPTEDRSVLTGRTMKEIAEQSPSRRDVWPRREIDLAGTPVGDLPEQVRPMLAVSRDEPFSKPGWVYEVKWDGYRAMARTEGGQVDLYSRNLQPLNDMFPPVVKALQAARMTILLDGEVVALSDEGKPDFELLRSHPPVSALVYYVFDILSLDRHDLTGVPLTRRKEILREVLPQSAAIRLSEDITEDGERFFALIAEQGLEGMMAKDGSSTYRPGKRSPAWIKVKVRQKMEAVIGGFTEEKEGGGLGAILLGECKDGKLEYIGHTGTGFDARMRSRLLAVLEPLQVEASPFAVKPRANGVVHWTEPAERCEVEFTEMTRAGRLRQPVFLRLLDGANEAVPTAEATTVEEASPEPPRQKFAPLDASSKSLTVDADRVTLSNLDKVYWPREGYTKSDLINYYRAVAGTILPYLQGRPETLIRYPNGVEGEHFFQKNSDGQGPDWLERVAIPSSSHGDITYILCQNEASLLYIVNLGSIALNPWNSRVGSLDRPDYAIIDLDPLDIGFDAVREAALTVHQILKRSGAEAFCKTSGATGLHILVPLGAKYDYDQVRTFAEIVARMANATLPESTSVERSPERRKGKVYLDFLQNRKAQTLASVYSARPFPLATVSTPVTWEEVERGITPDAFTIETVPERIRSVGDLFKGVLGPGADLSRILQNLSG